jgi:type I restriction enzyme, S subunit
MRGNMKNVPVRRFKEFENDDAWEECKLEDLCSIITKQTGFDYSATIKPSLKTEFSDTTYPFIQNKDFSGENINLDTNFFIPKEIAEKFPKILIDKPSILISISGKIGNVSFYSYKNKAFIGGAVGICKLLDTSNGLFVVYELLSDKGQLYFSSLTKTSSHANITVEDIRKIPIKLPKSAKEKEQVGEFFSEINKLITLNDRKLEKIKSLKKSYLVQMFPGKGENRPKIRFAGFNDDWEEHKLGDIVEFLDDKRKPLEAGTREKGEYPYYGASGIIDYVKDYIFDEELILLSEDGANIIDRNYRVCFLAKGKYWVNNHAHVLKSKDNYCNGFICEALERLSYVQYNTGTAQPKLNQEVCRNITILVPKFEEQQRIAEYLFSIDNLITSHQQKIEKLQNIKKAYLKEMFI